MTYVQLACIEAKIIFLPASPSCLLQDLTMCMLLSLQAR